jgi:hypothetical protein
LVVGFWSELGSLLRRCKQTPGLIPRDGIKPGAANREP